MDNKKPLPTVLPHSCAYRPQGPQVQLANIQFLIKLLRMGIAANNRAFTPALTLGKLRSIPFPLPTVEEQKRIVAKVDELMALCDQLEAQQQQQANTVLRANTAAIAALLNSESHSTNPLANKQNNADIAPTTAAKTNKIKNPTFEQNWQRIAQHFNTLYGCTLPMPPGEGRQKKYLVALENLRVFKKAVMSLALMGKLFDTKGIGSSDELLTNILSDQQEFLSKRELNKLLKLSSNVHMEFKVPDNWKWAKFSQCVMAVQTGPFGSALHKKDYVQGGIPVINPSNLKDGYIIPDDQVTIDENTFERLASYKLCESDIVLGRRGEMGRCAVVTKNQDGWLCGTGSLVIRTSHRMSNQFLTCLLRAQYVVDQLTEGAVGITMLNIGQTALLNLNVALPPPEEQNRIVAKVDELMTLCDQLEQQLTQSYSDAEKMMEATVQALIA